MMGHLTCYKCYLDIDTLSIESVPHPSYLPYRDGKEDSGCPSQYLDALNNFSIIFSQGICLISLICDLMLLLSVRYDFIIRPKKIESFRYICVSQTDVRTYPCVTMLICVTLLKATRELI